MPMRLVQQLLKSALTARAGPQSTALGATVPGASPCNTVMARPGRTHRSRAPAVSTGLIAGAHIEGETYLGGAVEWPWCSGGGAMKANTAAVCRGDVGQLVV